MTKCECGNEQWESCVGMYEGFSKCTECGFVGDLIKVEANNQKIALEAIREKGIIEEVPIKFNIIMPDDPMDALACESCQ